MIGAAKMAIQQLFSSGFRAVLWKSLGLTIAMLIGLWFVADGLFSTLLLPAIGPETWLATILSWLLGAGMIIGLGFLVAPVTSLFGGFFIDEIAEKVERKHYSQDQPGTPLPSGQAALLALKFTLLIVFTNLAALLLLLVPGINLIIFFFANGYLLGREYFQFVALRFLNVQQAEKMRKKYSGRIFLAGLMIAGFLTVPFVNLLTPLFASAFMVHVFKKLQARENT